MSTAKLSTIPLGLHRLAAQLVEDSRANEMMPEWDQAQLAAMAYELYRPDVDGVAYYEIPVVIEAADAKPAGFITVSTGGHDFPVAHWNHDGDSPCEKLQQRAIKAGHKAERFFKLDALAYAAENEAGELVATSDEQLLRVNGLDPAWLDEDFPLTQSSWKPSPEMADDTEADKVVGVLEVTGPDVIKSIEFTGWNSWSELKADYTTVYQLLIESLRRQASKDWEIDNLAKEYGEGLTKGKTYRLACLYPSVNYNLEGAGADFVKVELVNRRAAPPALEITVIDSSPDQEFPLEILLDYPKEDVRETVKFAIVAPKDYWGPRTVKLNPKVYGQWSDWQAWFAGTHDDQRWYDQIPPNTSPNTKDCFSGCGPTAWAMLFGWGDLMAHRNTARWRDRTGLYHAGGGRGGRTGRATQAPATRDAGVSNMIWEIHNLTNAFCVPFSDQCATVPSNMDRAAGYLSGRTAVRLNIDCSNLGITWNSLRDRARDVIKISGDPVIIGTGWLQHYPLAYGYRVRSRLVRWVTPRSRRTYWRETEYQHQFYVNQGFGEGNRSWVSGETWFAGWITP